MDSAGEYIISLFEEYYSHSAMQIMFVIQDCFQVYCCLFISTVCTGTKLITASFH